MRCNKEKKKIRSQVLRSSQRSDREFCSKGMKASVCGQVKTGGGVGSVDPSFTVRVVGF